MKTITVPGKTTEIKIQMRKTGATTPNCTPDVTVEASGFESGLIWDQVQQQITVSAMAEAGRADVMLSFSNGCKDTISFVVADSYCYATCECASPEALLAFNGDEWLDAITLIKDF